jgi:hypothetical protein
MVSFFCLLPTFTHVLCTHLHRQVVNMYVSERCATQATGAQPHRLSLVSCLLCAPPPSHSPPPPPPPTPTPHRRPPLKI